MNKDLVWYVAYGSNILRSRFLCYIKGGRAKGCKKEDSGCRNKAEPIKDKPIIIPYELYFAKEGTIWGEGAASFIKPKKSKTESTYARQYLITLEQFKDIVKQENNVIIENIEINVMDLLKEGELSLGAPNEMEWYGRIVHLGEDEGFPMLTFTAKWSEVDEYGKPSTNYLNTIKKGLKESHKLSEKEINDYFKQILNR